MTEISRAAAKALSDLMERERAIHAVTFVEKVAGVNVNFVRLYHSEQRDGDYETLHALGANGAVSLGTIPKK